MAIIDERARLVSVKVILAGQACAGKGSIVKAVAERFRRVPVCEGYIGPVRVMRTEFIWPEPLEGGWHLCVRLYAPTGANPYNAVEELLVREADGVIFVADVTFDHVEGSLESLQRLAFNARRNELELARIPIALQYHGAERHPNFEPTRMDEWLGVPTGAVPRFVTSTEMPDREGMAVDSVIAQIVRRLELPVFAGA